MSLFYYQSQSIYLSIYLSIPICYCLYFSIFSFPFISLILSLFIFIYLSIYLSIYQTQFVHLHSRLFQAEFSLCVTLLFSVMINIWLCPSFCAPIYLKKNVRSRQSNLMKTKGKYKFRPESLSDHKCIHIKLNVRGRQEEKWWHWITKIELRDRHGISVHSPSQEGSKKRDNTPNHPKKQPPPHPKNKTEMISLLIVIIWAINQSVNQSKDRKVGEEVGSNTLLKHLLSCHSVFSHDICQRTWTFALLISMIGWQSKIPFRLCLKS